MSPEAQLVFQTISVVLALLSLLAIPFVRWTVRTVRDIAGKLAEVTQTIYGTKGDNGLNGTVKDLRRANHAHANMLQRHEGQFEVQETRLDGHDRELAQIRRPG